MHIMPVNIAIILKEWSLDTFGALLEQDSDEELDSEDLKETVEPSSYWDIIKKRNIPD